MSVYPAQHVSAMRELINYLGSTLFCRVRAEENKIKQREVTFPSCQKSMGESG